MLYSRGAKCSLRSLFMRLNASRQHGERSYSACTFRTDVVKTKGFTSSYSFVNGCPMFMRKFSTGSSEQMDLIRQLREKTSAPIKDVKSSLVSCNWDIEAAHKDLRKKGVVVALKKSSRTATEGLLAVAQVDNKASVVELNCETDFVARNEIFQYLASSLAKLSLSAQSSGQLESAALSFGPEVLEDLTFSIDHPKLRGETTVRSAISEVAAMVGENVKLRRGYILSTSSHGVVSSYLHTSPQPGLGRIAGILSLEVENANAPLDALHRIGSSLAMHIVAARPQFLSKELVSSEVIEAEREILRSQAESSGKPPMAIEKMVEGRLRKYFEESVMLEQKFVVNDSISIKSVLSDLSKEVGSSVKIGSFLRMEVGEGIKRAESPEDTKDAAQVA